MSTEKGRWLLTETASRLFFVSSIGVLAAYTAIILLFAFARPLGLAASNSSPITIVAGIVLPAVGVPSAFIVLVGMLWYWVSFDDSRRLVKLLWLVSFLALGWYSMSIYYFLVYRRQRRLAGST